MRKIMFKFMQFGEIYFSFTVYFRPQNFEMPLLWRRTNNQNIQNQNILTMKQGEKV